MSCLAVGGAILCGPDPRGYRKRYWRCPMCECRTETVVIYELWHGMTVRCCRCGDGWSDGQLFTRAFYRYWRRDAQRRARQLWDQATHGPFPTLHELDPVMFPDPDEGPSILENR